MLRRVVVPFCDADSGGHIPGCHPHSTVILESLKSKRSLAKA